MQDFKKIASLFYLLYDLKGCYTTVDTMAANIYSDGGLIFSYFNSEARNEKVHKSLGIDELLDKAETANKVFFNANEIERSGRGLFIQRPRDIVE